MRKLLIMFCVLFLIAPLFAQYRTGNIYGNVVDEEGNSLPGVTVTLTGETAAEQATISSAEGKFRFMSLFPAMDYAIRLELAGFKVKIETGIIVQTGKNTNLTMIMMMGTIEEEVTVVAVSPVVDTKKTAISTTLTYEMLQSLPSARDPWVALQMTPAIQVDRENIGGNESGQQASFVALGGSGDNDTWTMDGVNITDPAAVGASPTYYDYDVFEEINITIGGADVEQHTGGVSLNFVSRRGGNRISLGGRFYYTESRFQAKPASNWDYSEDPSAAFPSNPTQWDDLQVLFGKGFGYNQIRDIRDYGFNLGGPVVKDKVWLWGSYGIQTIKTTVMNGSNDDTNLNNYVFKVNIQVVPENRFEFFIHSGDKKKYGRGSGSDYPAGRNQHGGYHFGSPILKFQDEHMFGDNLFVSAKYGFTDAGFGLWPADDEDLTMWRTYDQDLQLHSSYSWFMTSRPNTQITLHATYFNDNLFGTSHEIKVGFEWRHTQDQSVGGSAGNMRTFFNENEATVDWSDIDPTDGDTDADIMRDEFDIDLQRLYFYRGTKQYGPEGTYHVSGFLQDTISMGRFTLKLGLRYDRQQTHLAGIEKKTIFTEASSDQYYENYYAIQQEHLDTGVDAAILAIFPGIDIPAVARKDTVPWEDFSPRIGLTWDVTGDGKTIAKLSAAMYGGRMSSWPSYLWQQGGASGGLNFWWWDEDGNNSVAFSELYWADYSDPERRAYPAFSGNTFVGNWDREDGYMWSGYDPTNPGATTAPWYVVDPNWSSDKVYEVIATVEREIMTDFALALDFTWRKYNSWWTSMNYSDSFGGTLLQRSDFVQSPNAVPSSITDSAGVTHDMLEAAGRNIYVWAAGVNDVYGWYVTNTPDDYYDIYMGVNLRFTKRLSNKWMLLGSFTFQDQKNYWGDTWPLNQTDQWSEDGKLFGYSLGASSGKYAMRTFSKWMVKAQGLYQLPYDFNVSFTFNARQGHIVDEYVYIRDYDSPNSADTGENINLRPRGENRLPTFWNMNLRIEKVLRVGDLGKIYLMIDAFNVFNSSILNRRRDINTGTLYVSRDPQTISVSSRSGEPNEILNPRVFRFGLRFQF